MVAFKSTSPSSSCCCCCQHRYSVDVDAPYRDMDESDKDKDVEDIDDLKRVLQEDSDGSGNTFLWFVDRRMARIMEEDGENDGVGLSVTGPIP
ncbi:hypothetical protein RHSIM_RhsimUnG0221500 [Rhododendron simsii]|uniref:Uncharacterized protein n=1 Tax=Rhododendron simsii TaxID=118357 RepID=A0A834L239_RHOSS|nr:hypothetical protein RHSIM_RhsimUnG0221500 [Rhododendron simsii]